MTRIPVYLVSLKRDRLRRAELEKRFPKSYSEFIFIKPAVDGRLIDAKSYYDQVLPCFIDNGRLLSPSELGCTLSHMAILSEFLASSEKLALVIEDDVIGNEEDLNEVFINAQHLKGNSLYICGGQQSTTVRKFLLGKKTRVEGLFSVSRFSSDYILRTCCYVVTRSAAKNILDYYTEALSLADSWGDISRKKGVRIYYSDTIKHPDDLSLSHIEADRREIKDVPFIKKVLSASFFSRVGGFLFRNLISRVMLVFGYKRLYVK